jgi:hypothetical protein
MPRRKPKPEKVIQEKIKESLDSIIMDESLDSIDTILQDSSELPRLKTTEMMNFSDEKSSALSDAKALMDSLAEFYIDSKLLDSASHVELKKKLDAVNLSSMMFQLKTAQHAITKLLEEIDLGNMHPRIFEVLAQLQSQIMQMPKDYQAYLEKMEQNYKKTRIEIDEKKQSGALLMDSPDSDGVYNIGTSQTADGGLKSRGTRGIMEGLRGIIGSEVIIDIKPEEINSNSIVNAREKKRIEADNPDYKDTQNDEDGVSEYGIEDDIIQ